MVERMLLDAAQHQAPRRAVPQRDQGQLTVVATTHTQARYALPQGGGPLQAGLSQGAAQAAPGQPDEIVQMLLAGEADIGIATEALADVPELASFPFYGWHHAVIVPAGHPLKKRDPLTLEAIADASAHHLSRRLHRPHPHRPDLRRAG
jgi:LysR family cys regulon transcriptional activator